MTGVRRKGQPRTAFATPHRRTGTDRHLENLSPTEATAPAGQSGASNGRDAQRKAELRRATAEGADRDWKIVKTSLDRIAIIDRDPIICKVPPTCCK